VRTNSSPRMQGGDGPCHSESEQNNGQMVKPSAVLFIVLKRFAACLEQVKAFLESKGLTYPELEHADWLEKLALHGGYDRSS